MADEKPKDAKEEPGEGKPDATAKPDSAREPLQKSVDYIRKVITSAADSISSLGNPGRLLLAFIAVILAALILLWIIDKVVFYYLARTYVDQVADVFDLNEHLANVLVLLTFIAVLFFGRYIWSFSKRKRLVGIAGICALLIGHSLVLWYGTRVSIIGKYYVLSRDGKVTYREHSGVDPATGRQGRLVTPEMVERLRLYEAGKRPQRITNSNPTFFDPRSGEPIVWYYRLKDNRIEIFDLMGFYPDTGGELTPINEDVAEEWKIQQKTPRVSKRIDPQKYTFFDPLIGNPLAWYWLVV